MVVLFNLKATTNVHFPLEIAFLIHRDTTEVLIYPCHFVTTIMHFRSRFHIIQLNQQLPWHHCQEQMIWANVPKYRNFGCSFLALSKHGSSYLSIFIEEF